MIEIYIRNIYLLFHIVKCPDIKLKADIFIFLRIYFFPCQINLKT